MRKLIAALLLFALPALAQTPPGTPGVYGVIDVNGTIQNMVNWDGATPYTMPCQPCTFTPFSQLTSAQQQAWAARSAAATPTLAPVSQCGNQPGASGCTAITGQDGNSYLVPVYPQAQAQKTQSVTPP